MMPRLSILLLASLCLVMLTGCATSLVPFSHELREEHNLTTADLKNLQYYISSRVTLRRELTSDDKKITAGHKLVIVSGKQIEEVVIEEKTPAVAVDVGPRTITVSFEPGATMVFAAQSDRFTNEVREKFAAPPEPFPGNAVKKDGDPDPFPATTGAGSGNYLLAFDRDGSIVYQNKRFDVVESSSEAHLLIDASALKKVETNTKVVPGMKLN